MVMPGWPRRDSSHSASTVKGLSSAISFSRVRSRVPSGRRRPEPDAEAPVLPALLLDLADMDLADLAGPSNMCASAGLAVNGGVFADAHQPDAPRSARRPDILGFDQARVGRQFVIRDPANEDRVVPLHQFHQLPGHMLLRETGVRQVEVHAGVILRYSRPRDRERAHHAEQMAGGMHTHEPVSPLPVAGKPDTLSYLWKGLVGRRDMDDLVLGFARHGCRDDDPVAARTLDHTDIARLAARRRIEDRTVQNDAAAIVHVQNGRLGFAQIGIVAEQRFRAMGHQATSWTGSGISLFSSIHVGIGRFLLRRKWGLNSFD